MRTNVGKVGSVTEPRDRRDVLLDAGLSLASELSLPGVLQRLVDLAAEVTGARYGALGVIGDDGRLTDFVTHGMTARQRKLIGQLPQGRGLLGYLIRHPKPLRVADISKRRGSVGFPKHHPPMKSFLGAPILAMGKVYGNIYLTEKRRGEPFTAEDERSIAVLGAQAGSAIANATLYEQMRSRERWLDALRTITGEILAGADTDTVLRRIARDARDLAGAAIATIVSATEAGELVVSVAVGDRAAALEGQTVPPGASISGDVMESGKPRVYVDASLDRNAFPGIIQAARIGPAIFVPLRVRGTASGALMVANHKEGAPFSDRTVRLVETFADQASVAIAYSRAQADQRRLGLMAERERIAKELHDGIIQSLFAVGMGLQGTALMAGAPEVTDRLERAVGELDRVIRDLRNYIFGLRPGILADRSLDQALRALGEEVAARSKLDVSVRVDPRAAAALATRSHDLVQLTREALSNVVRHANASHVWVRLTSDDGEAVLTVEDDGVGFDTRAAGAGNGLPNMRGRAAALQGTLRITSRDGKGTRLRLAVRT
jgi:two-component system, NarL family, sensor histidine kinase DevS